VTWGLLSRVPPTLANPLRFLAASALSCHLRRSTCRLLIICLLVIGAAVADEAELGDDASVGGGGAADDDVAVTTGVRTRLGENEGIDSPEAVLPKGGLGFPEGGWLVNSTLLFFFLPDAAAAGAAVLADDTAAAADLAAAGDDDGRRRFSLAGLLRRERSIDPEEVVFLLP
jgi:hypothetical protein